MDTRVHAGVNRLGWNDELRAWWETQANRFADLPDDSCRIGRVGRVDRGECDVFVGDGELRVLSDSQRSQDATAPATGDWVVAVDDEELGWMIAEVFPRRSAIVRRSAGERIEEQTLVANVDLVGIVHGLDHPVNQARLERFLVLAFDSGADAMVILTKGDLVDGPARIAARAAVAEVTDVPVLCLGFGDGVDDGDTGEGLGDPAELTSQLGGRSLVFLGPSGAGKSTLVNRIVGTEIQPTASVRESDGRGRHTTVTRDLFPLDSGGVLIDTPGVRSVGVWAADVALDRVYQDIAATAAGCRFNDCTHRTEPGCAVTAAVADGELNQGRLDRYHQLWEEITQQARHAEEQQWKKGRR